MSTEFLTHDDTFVLPVAGVVTGMKVARPAGRFIVAVEHPVYYPGHDDVSQHFQGQNSRHRFFTIDW